MEHLELNVRSGILLPEGESWLTNLIRLLYPILLFLKSHRLYRSRLSSSNCDSCILIPSLETELLVPWAFCQVRDSYADVESRELTGSFEHHLTWYRRSWSFNARVKANFQVLFVILVYIYKPKQSKCKRSLEQIGLHCQTHDRFQNMIQWANQLNSKL